MSDEKKEKTLCANTTKAMLFPATQVSFSHWLAKSTQQRALSLGKVFLILNRNASTSKPVMILPQVRLRKPCYDFYFL